MLVSIIIPNYNYGNFLAQCITSVLNQTYQNIEIILVDDFSTDNSLDIAQEFTYDCRFRILALKENKGVAYCRNMGIEESQGEYICLLDADDYWLPNKLEIQLKAIDSQQSNVCFTDISIFKNNNIVHTRRHFCKKYNLENLLKLNFIAHSSLMVKRETLGDVRYKTVQVNSKILGRLLRLININNLIHEDYAFLLELYRSRNIISSYIPESLVVYRTHSNNFSKSYFKKIISLFLIYKNRESLNVITSCAYTIRISILAFLKNTNSDK